MIHFKSSISTKRRKQGIVERPKMVRKNTQERKLSEKRALSKAMLVMPDEKREGSLETFFTITSAENDRRLDEVLTTATILIMKKL